MPPSFSSPVNEYREFPARRSPRSKNYPGDRRPNRNREPTAGENLLITRRAPGSERGVVDIGCPAQPTPDAAAAAHVDRSHRVINRFSPGVRGPLPLIKFFAIMALIESRRGYPRRLFDASKITTV